MGTSNLKSAQVTNFDASPAVASSKGSGAPYNVNAIDAAITTVSADDTSSTYIFFRVPSNIIVKGLYLRTAAMGGSSAVNIGVNYADDGRYVQDQDKIGDVIDADFFKAAQSLVSALVIDTDVTAGNILATFSKLSLPLWQALGLSSDPGGHFDIVAAVSTAINTGANFYMRLEFVGG